MEAYHVVLTTHNSRTSERMRRLRIKKGDPIELNLTQEIALTEIIRDIIIEKGYRCLAYNVCKDHVHMVIVCAHEELTGTIQRIKSKSSKEIKKHLYDHDPMERVPLNNPPVPLGNKKGNKTYIPFWSQKFFRADLDVWSLSAHSSKSGYKYKSSYLTNAINYIKTNRQKHNLPASKELQGVIDEFIMTQEEAFRDSA